MRAVANEMSTVGWKTIDLKKILFTAGGIATGFVVAVALQIAIGGSGSSADAQLATEAPPIPVAAAAAPAAVPGAPAAAPAAPAAPAPAAAPADHRFGIDPGQSTAKIVVQQTGLLGASTLVGTGSNVSGNVNLTPNGQLADGASGFQLDMQTMRSNDSYLNSFLKNDTEPAKYPTASFAIQSVDGIPADYTNGNEFSFTMTGLMTLHGQTHPATWTAKARQVGNFLTMAADTDFNMTDYGWAPPDYGVAKAKNSVHLQVVVVAAE